MKRKRVALTHEEALKSLGSDYPEFERESLEKMLEIGTLIMKKINDNLGVEFIFDEDEQKAFFIKSVYDLLTEDLDEL
jgi:hypothetical protein